VNGDQDNDDASASGAAYVFVRSGSTWTQQAYLKASNTGYADGFGTSVSISGDTIVVGSWLESSNAIGVNGDQDNDDAIYSGAAYVFVREGTTWTQQAYLKASNTGVGDYFGVSVSISGDAIVVGAHHEASNATGVNGDQDNNDIRDSGAAYVFGREGTTWTQRAYLKAASVQPNGFFGLGVAVDDFIVIGNLGSATVFDGLIATTITTGSTTRTTSTTATLSTTGTTGTTETTDEIEASGSRCCILL
jgi:hypothetical protein